MLFSRKNQRINRVLVVEDEAIVAFDHESLLLDAGYDVVGTIDNATEAIALIGREPIDLVLTDIAISGDGNGLDVARAAHGRGIAVLYAAGSCPVGGEAYAVGCLAKPFSALILKAAIRAVEQVVAGRAPSRLPDGLTLYGQAPRKD